jgi:hypothetical protein
MKRYLITQILAYRYNSFYILYSLWHLVALSVAFTPPGVLLIPCDVFLFHFDLTCAVLHLRFFLLTASAIRTDTFHTNPDLSIQASLLDLCIACCLWPMLIMWTLSHFSIPLWPNFITTMNFTWESSFKLQKKNTAIFKYVCLSDNGNSRL